MRPEVDGVQAGRENRGAGGGSEHRGAELALVLLVDDDPAILGVLERILGGLPVRLRCAESAEAALEVIGAEAPALLVSDNGLPGMSGLELLERVRERWPNVRMALHTADPVAQGRAVRLRVPFIEKGAPPEEIRQLVTGLLEG